MGAHRLLFLLILFASVIMALAKLGWICSRSCDRTPQPELQSEEAECDTLTLSDKLTTSSSVHLPCSAVCSADVSVSVNKVESVRVQRA